MHSKYTSNADWARGGESSLHLKDCSPKSCVVFISESLNNLLRVKCCSTFQPNNYFINIRSAVHLIL